MPTWNANEEANGETKRNCCKICGDSAGCGVNFGCLSCESCKAFFRRCSVRAHSLPKCPFSGHCRITKASRRACQACRLTNCEKVAKKSVESDHKYVHKYAINFLNGMRKEMVDVWKKVRQRTTIERGGEAKDGTGKGNGIVTRKRNGIDNGRVNGVGSTNRNGHAGRKSGGKGDEEDEKRGRSCCECKCVNGKQMTEKGTQTEEKMPTNGGAKENQKGGSGMEQSQTDNINTNFEWHPLSLLCSLPSAVDGIPQHQTLLNELVRANSVLDAPLRVPNPHVLSLDLTLMDALRVCGWAMRRMVTMCKQLNAFRSLPQSDQITLLRAGLIQLLILRGAMAFDRVNEVWRHAVLVGNTSGPYPFMLNLNVLPATERHYQEHKRFLLTFGDQWRTDRNVMLLLHAIVLFSPQTDPLEAREVIRTHRKVYCELLKRHLDGVAQNAQCAATAFAHLMAKLDELVKLNSSFHLICMQLNQNELEPLFRELFTDK